MLKRIFKASGVLLFTLLLLVFMGMQVVYNTPYGWDYEDVARFVGCLVATFVLVPLCLFQVHGNFRQAHPRAARTAAAFLAVGIVGMFFVMSAYLVLLLVATFG